MQRHFAGHEIGVYKNHVALQWRARVGPTYISELSSAFLFPHGKQLPHKGHCIAHAPPFCIVITRVPLSVCLRVLPAKLPPPIVENQFGACTELEFCPSLPAQTLKSGKRFAP